jgi:hypothetical protein
MELVFDLRTTFHVVVESRSGRFVVHDQCMTPSELMNVTN